MTVAAAPTPEQWLALLAPYISPVPTPPGFSSREIARRAIEFDNPPRIPYSFIDPVQSDFLELAVMTPMELDISQVPRGEMVFDAWGCGRRSSGTLWGHAEVHPLADLSSLEGYRFPEILSAEQRLSVEAVAAAGAGAGKYVVAADLIGGIERLRMLVGFDNLLLALYTDRERVEALLDRLTDATLDLVDVYRRMGGIDGFMTWEDWGLQTSLQIRPQQWREIFKPRYRRIVEAAHRAGMHYMFHCCGWILEIIPDLVEIGMDVLQLDQPRLMGMERLADDFGGKICFWNTVDIQWSTGAEASEEDARAEARRLVDIFGRFNGGLIARQYPQPHDIGMSHEMHRAIYEGFMDAGCR